VVAEANAKVAAVLAVQEALLPLLVEEVR